MRRLLPFVKGLASVTVGFLCLGSICEHKTPTEIGIDSVFGHVETVWLRSHEHFGWNQPAFTDGVVLLATGSGHVLARGALTGDSLWSVQVSGGSLAGGNMLVRGDIAVVPVFDSTVGINVRDGTLLWGYEHPIDTLALEGPRPGTVSMTSIDGTSSVALVGVWGGTVSALEIATGRLAWLWSFAASDGFRSGVSGVRISGDTAYASVWHFLDAQGLESEAWVVALRVATGEELWRLRTVTGQLVLVMDQPAVWEGHLFQSSQGRLIAIDRFQPAIDWIELNEVVGPAAVLSATVFDGIVYMDARDEYLYALDAASGAVSWRTKVYGGYSDMFVSESRIYLPDNKFLNILDRRTGRFIARLTVPGGPAQRYFHTRANVRDHIVYIGITGGAWAFREP